MKTPTTFSEKVDEMVKMKKDMLNIFCRMAYGESYDSCARERRIKAREVVDILWKDAD